MRFILTIVTLAGVILYGILNKPDGADRVSGPTPTVTFVIPTRNSTPVPPIPPQVPQGEGQIERRELTPTLVIVTSAPSPPAVPSPVVTIASDDVTEKSSLKVCTQLNCVTWSQRVTVPRTMNRWEIWEQQVGSGMMSWEHFAVQVEQVNPILVSDGHMFKAGKFYLLPACIEMENH